MSEISSPWNTPSPMSTQNGMTYDPSSGQYSVSPPQYLKPDDAKIPADTKPLSWGGPSGANWASNLGSAGASLGSTEGPVGSVVGGLGGMALGTGVDFLLNVQKQRAAQQALERNMRYSELQQSDQQAAQASANLHSSIENTTENMQQDAATKKQANIAHMNSVVNMYQTMLNRRARYMGMAPQTQQQSQ